MNSKISDKDKKDWDNFLSSSESLPNKDSNFKENKTIQDFIHQAYKDKINKLIVVTGKGLHSKNEQDPYVSKDLGILKHSVPQFIKSDKSLMQIINRIEDAKIEDGGSGAFYIFLKKMK